MSPTNKAGFFNHLRQKNEPVLQPKKTVQNVVTLFPAIQVEMLKQLEQLVTKAEQKSANTLNTRNSYAGLFKLKPESKNRINKNNVHELNKLRS